MIDIQLLRKEPEKLKKAVADKQYDSSIVDAVLELDEEYRKLLNEVESLRAERNKAAKNKDIDKGKQIKKEIQDKEPKLIEAENTLNEKLGEIPNPALPQVPVGKNDKENVEVRLWGEPRKFEFEPKGHLELGTKLGILDFESGSKVTGSQFYYLFDDGALMELALIQYAFELLSAEGFRPVITPDLAKSRYYLGTGYMPKGNEAQTYEIKDEELGLIATAEVTLAGMHADEIIPDEKLPLKYIGYSHCFRREAGAYGKYSKGLYRVHQFTKAEMFIYCKQEESEKMHEHILAMEEKIYQNLGLPYRVVEMCTGDLGAMAARKFDVEVWMPGRGDYGEVTSTSNCTDYQARNLNIRYKKKDGKIDFLHMLNGTAIVTSRVPLAILENFQQEDGSVVIPEVLRKWMGKEVIK
ncbi:MAG: Serine-tRNA ligase [Candidatus Woesebacteria bacterium GW2011_GWA1_39_8]|uniref:Serine--tRNA ligase n=1 Tax=Candidatus Woesebacteria bacterium GW2011_GWA1_39_8 TaxID=1618552 RepID=A0A0G0PPT5_9BACT|nr:MAG: Serine-tRNA ligase [Candidatus Woesebacteria bacterium GW2011_GWA1_39_8]